jgi:UDP-N-acetylmuramoylalanine--D-glutamate ligase
VLADSVGVTAEQMKQAIQEFRPVAHRLELVRIVNGVQYVNDSIATSPERAIAALGSFEEQIVLLAGGRDKDMIWDEWGERVIERTKAVVLLGELSQMMAQLLGEKASTGTKSPALYRVQDMAEAVQTAAEIASSGDVVLLSPGGTSYDAYFDFAARGDSFRNEVNKLAELQAPSNGQKATAKPEYPTQDEV